MVSARTYASFQCIYIEFSCCMVAINVMRIVEALEGKGCRVPLVKGLVELAEKLAAITRQLRGSGAELSSRVQNLLTVSRVQANAIGAGGSLYLPGSTKIHEQSCQYAGGITTANGGHCKAWQRVEARHQGYGDNNG
ncbi:hypothetical protein HRI_001180800 [Hibiscus trionum]|uniref:Uncharacterized protein n=1 Tax=Hibiscus trionum TaxID=183268 RepID=A0A9W7HG13_HIBTR|nr:hypothetical protein HRI_001180800 [Hibiscus trionum]